MPQSAQVALGKSCHVNAAVKALCRFFSRFTQWNDMIINLNCVFILHFFYIILHLFYITTCRKPCYCTVAHYGDVIMGTIASQITSLMIVYSIVYSDADQENIKAPRHWSVCGEFTGDRWIHRGPVNSPHKWPVTRRKMFPCLFFMFCLCTVLAHIKNTVSVRYL